MIKCLNSECKNIVTNKSSFGFCNECKNKSFKVVEVIPGLEENSNPNNKKELLKG